MTASFRPLLLLIRQAGAWLGCDQTVPPVLASNTATPPVRRVTMMGSGPPPAVATLLK